MLSHKSNSLLYITRTGFSFFSKDFQNGLVLNVSDEIIKDLEIISKVKLREQIELFLTQNKIQPTKAVVVLSDDILFSKFVTVDLVQQEKEIRDFLDEVPFDYEDLVCKLKKDSEKVSVVATNSDLYLTIKNILESKDWCIEMVVPDVGEIPNSTNWQDILTKALGLKQCNFLTNKKNNGDFLNSASTGSHHGRFLAIGAVIFLLAIAMLFLVVYFK